MSGRRPSFRADSRGVVLVLNVEAYRASHPDADVSTCGDCGRSWDDAVATGWTPAPSTRCPFEGMRRYTPRQERRMETCAGCGDQFNARHVGTTTDGRFLCATCADD